MPYYPTEYFDGICHALGGHDGGPRCRFDLIDDVNRCRAILVRENHPGHRAGDFVREPGGVIHRIAVLLAEGVQLSTGGNFHLAANGYSEFSGGCGPYYPYGWLRQSRDLKGGAFWFFHHNEPGAGRGVYFTAPCRVFDLIIPTASASLQP